MSRTDASSETLDKVIENLFIRMLTQLFEKWPKMKFYIMYITENII